MAEAGRKEVATSEPNVTFQSPCVPFDPISGSKRSSSNVSLPSARLLLFSRLIVEHTYTSRLFPRLDSAAFLAF